MSTGGHVSPSKPSTRKRPRGEGAVFQRCDMSRGCPPREPVTQPDGTVKMVRPEHKCGGLWIARLELDDGTRVQRAARSRNLALARLDEMKREVSETGGVAKSKLVRDWATYWVDEVAVLRPKTRTNYRSILRNHVLPKIGHLQVRKLTPKHIRDLLAELSSLTSTRRQAYTIVREMLEAARKEGFATRNVADVVGPPNPKRAERKGPTTDQCRTLLSYNARSGDRLASRWTAVFFTLQRQGECLGLEWDRVDWDRDVLDVSWQLDDLPYKHGCGEPDEDGTWPCGAGRAGSCPQRSFDVHPDYEYRQLYGALSLVVPKSEKGIRVIPMLPTMRVMLEQRWEMYQAERSSYVEDYGLVWCRPDGKPITASADAKAWHALCSAAGIGKYDLHGGRHSGGTLLLEAGVSEPVVQALMGHSTARVTRGYQHADLTLMRAEMTRAIEQPLALE